MAKTNRQVVKGMLFTNIETKEQVIFGKWNENGTAGCITKSHLFKNIEKEEFDSKYMSEAEFKKRATAKRRGQGW
jgi:hypothetical protein